jgi:twinkle protein
MNKAKTNLPCPCGTSSDAYSIQENGWGRCFSCSKNFPPTKDDRMSETVIDEKPAEDKSFPPASPITTENARDFRGIKRETIKTFKVDVAGNPSESPYIAKYPRFNVNGQHVRNKVRKVKMVEKDGKPVKQKYFTFEGPSQPLTMFGMHVFPKGCSKMITITEGQDDAMAAYEMLGSRYPVVSVDSASNAAKDCTQNFEYLNSFEEIVFCFDNDEPGRKAALDCATLFAPNKVKIFQHGKDAPNDPNAWLIAKRAGEFVKEWWKAQPYTPDGLKIGKDMWDETSSTKSNFSIPYPFDNMNDKTYGLRLSEVVLFTADTGVGKTSIIKEIEHSLLTNKTLVEKGYGVGFLHLEETNKDTCLGIMSIEDNKPYHLPDTPRDDAEFRAAFDKTINTDRVVIWDHFGSNTVEAVLSKIRHMAALGCKYIVLDHLSIIVSDQSGDERKQLDEISTKLKTLCMNLDIAVIAVIHTNRSGQIRGSAGPEQIANIIFKLAREKDSSDEWRRNITKVVVDKNRFCGRTGPGIYFFYNAMTGRLEELSAEDVRKYEEGDSPNVAEQGW